MPEYIDFFAGNDNAAINIRYLALCISRELGCSAAGNALESDFGVDDYQVLDLMIGGFGESSSGATSIFDLDAQSGGSVGDYLHATSSMSDGTEIHVLPFESRKLYLVLKNVFRF